MNNVLKDDKSDLIAKAGKSLVGPIPLVGSLLSELAMYGTKLEAVSKS